MKFRFPHIERTPRIEKFLTINKWVASCIMISSLLVASIGFVPYNFLFTTTSAYLWVISAVIMKDQQILFMNALVGTLSLMAFINNASLILDVPSMM